MKTNREIAEEVLKGIWGNGDDRRARLTAAGYDYLEVQKIVNAILKGEEIPETSDYLEVHVDLSKYKGITLVLEG